jgi:hypothetical protein
MRDQLLRLIGRLECTSWRLFLQICISWFGFGNFDDFFCGDCLLIMRGIKGWELRDGKDLYAIALTSQVSFV